MSTTAATDFLAPNRQVCRRGQARPGVGIAPRRTAVRTLPGGRWANVRRRTHARPRSPPRDPGRHRRGAVWRGSTGSDQVWEAARVTTADAALPTTLLRREYASGDLGAGAAGGE